ncbi:MAG: nitric oxide synthase [Actinobacteria bacterium RBG_16_64_13]|nr:MAG: nitric oxide synthase [Actinobacteria bacterium RBG_16_64_13]
MKKVLVVYVSLTGRTKRMAEYIAEGLRFAGLEAVVKKSSDITAVEDLAGYDGYIFGSPTYHRDMAGPMKNFLFLAKGAELKGRLCGAFGSFTHSGDAPAMILETMEYVFGMEPISLGSFNLKEALVGTDEGMRSCHDYGRAFGERLSG